MYYIILKNLCIKHQRQILVSNKENSRSLNWFIKIPIEDKTSNPKILFYNYNYNYEINQNNYYCHSWKIYKKTLAHEFIMGGRCGETHVYPVMYYNISPIENISLKQIDCVLINNRWIRITNDIKKTFLN